MKHVLVLAASALLLTMLTPETADAQGYRRGVNQGGVARRGVAIRPGYRRGYAYRGRGYGAGAAAVGLGVLGAAAVGAAVAAPYGYGYGYGDSCLRQQQVADAWGNVYWQTVRVC
jgi:hypothetical protein